MLGFPQVTIEQAQSLNLLSSARCPRLGAKGLPSKPFSHLGKNGHFLKKGICIMLRLFEGGSTARQFCMQALFHGAVLVLVDP
jgi:hypothetical protein